jgi:exodeoxyribonuclease VII small subunit
LTAADMPKASPATAPSAGDLPPLPATYEAALQELEALVGRIESGQMPLDELLGAYQRGASLLGFCRSKLDAVDEQIKVLDDGALKPWSAQA